MKSSTIINDCCNRHQQQQTSLYIVQGPEGNIHHPSADCYLLVRTYLSVIHTFTTVINAAGCAAAGCRRVRRRYHSFNNHLYENETTSTIIIKQEIEYRSPLSVARTQHTHKRQDRHTRDRDRDR